MTLLALGLSSESPTTIGKEYFLVLPVFYALTKDFPQMMTHVSGMNPFIRLIGVFSADNLFRAVIGGCFPAGNYLHLTYRKRPSKTDVADLHETTKAWFFPPLAMVYTVPLSTMFQANKNL